MYIHKYIYISKCIKQHKIISTTARRGMGAEVEIYIRGKGNHAHSSLVRKQRSSRGWFSIQRETRIPTWFLSQREGRPVLPMSLLFCGALLGSTATCGTRPMRGERDDVITEHSGIHKTNDGKWGKKKTAQKRQRTTIRTVSDGLRRVKLDLSAFLYRSARENQAFAHFKNFLKSQDFI